MLILSRKTNEAVQIGPGITVRVLKLDGNTVRLGFEAPPEVRICRAELYTEVADGNRVALTDPASVRELARRLSLPGRPQPGAPAPE